MNTAQHIATRLMPALMTTRVAAFASALFVTVVMLGSVNALATSDAPAPLLAQVHGQAADRS